MLLLLQEEAQPVTLAMVGPVRSAGYVNGPLTVSQGEPVPEWRFRVYQPNGALRGTLANVLSATWEDQWCDAGGGSVTLAADEPTAALPQRGDTIRCFYRGVAAFQWTVTSWALDTVPADGSEGTRTWSGPGRITTLNTARVRPSRGFNRKPIEDTRNFGWTAPDYDGDLLWPAAKEIVRQGAPSVGSWEIFNRVPADWPYPNAFWIWGPQGTSTWAPTGWCYFIFKAVVPAGVEQMRVFAAADNVGYVWFDGVQMLRDIGFAETSEFDVELTPGTHTISAAVWNAEDDGEPGGNPGGFLSAGAELRKDGTLGQVIFWTDGLWRVSAYPAREPGTTPGATLFYVLTEAQNAGLLPGLTWSFDAWVDSSGRPWPAGPGSNTSTPVGTDLWALLRQMADTDIDFRLRPGSYVLDAWAKNTGGLDRSSSIVLRTPTDVAHPTTGNLLALGHAGEDTLATAALVRWSDGWTYVDTLASPKVEIQLVLGHVESEDYARRLTLALLDRMGSPRREFDAEIEPRTGEVPWLNYRVGDIISVPDEDGNPTVERVVALAATIEGDELTIRPTLRDRIAEDVERHEAWLKQVADGTARGTTQATRPPVAKPQQASRARYDEQVWHLPAGLTGAVAQFGPWSPPGPANLHRVRLASTPAVGATVTVTVYRNGVSIGSAQITAGRQSGWEYLGATCQPDDVLTVASTDPGGADISVTIDYSRG